MDSIMTSVQRMKPTFERATRNSYISSAKETFISLIYFVVTASLLGMVADVLSLTEFAAELGNYLQAVVMLIFANLGLLCAAIAPRHLSVHLNAKLEGTHKINASLYTITSITVFCLLTNQLEGLMDVAFFGVEHVVTGLIAAFCTGGIFSIVLKKVTWKLPEGYPPNGEQYLKEVFAIIVSLLLALFVDYLCLEHLGYTFAGLVFKSLYPVYNFLNHPIVLVLIAGFMALIWFSGVHDSSVVDPFIMPAALYFAVQNYFMVHIGGDAVALLTPATRYFIMALGGTGATLVPCLMFKHMSKHEEIRKMAIQAWKPVVCGVNEPVLYGVPLVQNKTFIIPFIVAPMVNVAVYSFYVLHLGATGFIYVLPWFVPGPIGIVLCAALQPMSLLILASLLVLDFLIYLPFFNQHEKEYEEGLVSNEDVEELAAATSNTLENKRILLLCAGGGTSGIVASRMQQAADEEGLSVVVDSGAYGAHSDMLTSYDLIALAPQVNSYLPAIEQEAHELSLTCIGLTSDQYMTMLETPLKGLEILSESF